MALVILGLHPIEAPEPCFLFEVQLDNAENFDWGSITQEIAGTPSLNWQTAWDEKLISEDRWIFFFHFLELDQPLITSEGSFRLPLPTPRPDHLRSVAYESPR
jgi:hypothetical protein